MFMSYHVIWAEYGQGDESSLDAGDCNAST